MSPPEPVAQRFRNLVWRERSLRFTCENFLRLTVFPSFRGKQTGQAESVEGEHENKRADYGNRKTKRRRRRRNGSKTANFVALRTTLACCAARLLDINSYLDAGRKESRKAFWGWCSIIKHDTCNKPTPY
ncbi:hypothetical protein MGYG_01171 [Nannizzia gypsea CBS 118893]|uniref:Uncharacterized protein n=1 Tax=Arthroderma gypseum (strain ATCC MYA-4604 / CBS 118893) TaxID=535722 RepID=E5QZB7_ARTGP|nr:hypothetical protein MGYG_01171 [Nannizzia gypsea CBS 118893]EFQ98135.1 hypothetical protein MGYG_01171 [Nannizzia gypsea CBS 118893]